MMYQNSLLFAQEADSNDPLYKFRNEFIIPEEKGKQLTYFLGNSLGLQPKRSNEYIQRILQDWARWGVESFFHATEPWMDYHDFFTQPLATITGALPQEIVVMNQLTVNLHLLLVSFYRPTQQRYKIICEAKAFPSDQYAFETHLQQHGYSAAEAIIEIHPRAGEHALRNEDILSTIQQHNGSVALVLLSGINYYTGQVFDMATITAAAKKTGATVGFDLAHAAGNITLQLHDWQVDFACWCSYKYLNSGPGAIGGVFIHEQHHASLLPRFAGWWGYDKATRFKMEPGFKPMPGAEGWQLSTPSLLLYACHRAALSVIEDAGWISIQKKSKQLTGFLWFLLQEITADTKNTIELITPANEKERGCQVSMLMLKNGKAIYDSLVQEGFMVDWREPNVIRLAPVPLYNTFEEVWRFVNTLQKRIEQE